MNLEQHPTVKRYREKATAGVASEGASAVDARSLKDLAIEAGADDVGLVEVTRPALADQLGDIRAAFPAAKTLVSLVCRQNPENIRCRSRGVANNDFLLASKAVDAATRHLAQRLAEQGVRCLTPPAAFPMDTHLWPGKMWPVSHKPVAEQAGLGCMGHHRNLIHPKFGNFVSLGTVVLDRDVTAYDEPLDFNPCLGCKLCASVCPVGAVAADGHFNFAACGTHNYRYRLGGFADWAENLADSKNRLDYRRRVRDAETVSMWQGLTYSISNTCSNCMAACPAGEEVIGAFLEDRKGYSETVVKPLTERGGPVFVVPGSDAEAHASNRFSAEQVKRVGNGLRPNSARGFLGALPVVFQRGQSEGLDATYHFVFTGSDPCDGTVTIRDQTLEVSEGLNGGADLRVTADGATWVAFLAGETKLLWALMRGKIKLKGPASLMKAFARCFPS